MHPGEQAGILNTSIKHVDEDDLIRASYLPGDDATINYNWNYPESNPLIETMSDKNLKTKVPDEPEDMRTIAKHAFA